MPSRWRWCPNCRRWFYPDPSSTPEEALLCPVCRRPSLPPEQAPGRPPANGAAN